MYNQNLKFHDPLTKQIKQFPKPCTIMVQGKSQLNNGWGLLNYLMVRVLLVSCLLVSSQAKATFTPEEIIKKLDYNFSKIKDAHGDITLDVGLQILGCGGTQRQDGHLWYKAPNKIKIKLDKVTYFFQGNRIRKIDEKGKRYYVYLLHAPDFSPGFNPNLIPHNFNLKLVSSSGETIALEGIPKPGVLKNVNKVVFYIDSNRFLLYKMDFFLKQNLRGYALIHYQNLGGFQAPTATQGRSALELFDGKLIGMVFALKGQNVRLNTGLPDKIFEAGF
jgi:hypothetical protein